MGIGHRFFAQPPPNVRMDHIALDRAGTDERDGDNQVGKTLGLKIGCIWDWARLST